MDHVTSQRQFGPSLALQFSLEEHLQENAPVTPSKSSNKSRLTKSEGETISTVPFSRQPDTHFIFDEPLPTNPNNSPASESEQPNQLSSAYSYRERNNSPSSQKPNIITTTWPDCSENVRANFSTNERGTIWRPPRPPKPAFLTVVEGFKLSRQAQPRARIISPARKHPKPLAPAILLQSRRWPRPYSRFVENTPSEEKNASAVQRKDTWMNPSLLKPHRQGKIAHCGAENAYRVLLGDPDKPFPAPIPTNDRLPLLRAVLSPESRIAFLRSLSTDYGPSPSRPKEDKFLKHLAGLLSRPSRLIPHWQKLRSSTPITLTLYQTLHSQRCSSLVQVSYMVHVEAALSADRDGAADSQKDGPSCHTSMDRYARLFQLRFPVPTLCFDIVRPFVIGMRHPILVTIASVFVCVLAIILRYLVGMGFRSRSSLEEDHPYSEEEDSDSAALQN